MHKDKATIETLSRLQVLVDALRATNSTTEKVAIIKQFPDLKLILNYVYNPWITFGVTWDKVIEAYARKQLIATEKYYRIYDLLDDLKFRKITGLEAVSYIMGFKTLYYRYEELIGCIINKDLKTRTGAALINKAFPYCVPEFGIALANEYFEHNHQVDFEKDAWYMSRKMDGVRVLTVCDEKGIRFYSRNGIEFTIFGNIVKELEYYRKHIWEGKGFVLDGEMCVVDEDGKDNFKAMLSAIHRKGYSIENFRYYVFDFLSIDDFKDMHGMAPFSKRQERLKHLERYTRMLERPKVVIVKQFFVKSEEMMLKNLDVAISKKWEGLILRRDASYKGKRSNDLLKVKKFKEDEFKVIGITTGPFRVIGADGLETTIQTMSAAQVEYKGNEVSVGSGWSIDERKKYFAKPSLIIGKTITVSHFGESEDKSGKKSLRFPTLKSIWEGERDV